MKPEVVIQIASKEDHIPDAKKFIRWVHQSITALEKKMEMTIRVVDEEEGAELNYKWRHKTCATNVLSFPYQDDQIEKILLLGDIIICAPIVKREAAAQNKSLESHWAHLVVHGSLHLLGYDHINEVDAKKMESRERHILTDLGHADPYQQEKL